jgi:membrane protein
VVGPKQVFALAKDTFSEFFKDEATWKAAALSYFTVFALAPLLVLLLQVASFIWDPAQVRDALTGQFQALMGPDVARQVETMMTSAERKTAAGSGFRLVLSIAGLLFGATGAFVSLQTALNRAWEVEPDPKSGGIKNFITKRFLSLGMVLGIAFLLLVSLAVTAALSAAGDTLFGGFGERFAYVLNFILTFSVISLLFAAMFKVLPDAKVGWRDVWVGAVATALFFVIGKFLIGVYIGQSDPGSAFGAAGSLAVLLVWIYYAAVIVLLGAEFTQAWIKMHGREIEPEEGAVRMVERKERVPSSSDNGSDNGSDDGNSDDRGAKPRREPEGVPERLPHRAPAFAAARSNQDFEVRSRKMRDDGHGDERTRVQHEMEETRERMSDTLSAIESRVSEATDGVKEKLDVSRLVREHPWPALAAAVAAGVVLSGTRADEKVAGATVEAAKRGSSAAADGVRQLGEAAASRLHGGSDDAVDDEVDTEQGDGFVQRAKTTVVRAVQNQARELEHEVRRASEEIGRPA